MIVSAVAAQEKIEVADDEVEGRLSEIAAANRQPIAKIREHMEKNNLLGQLKSSSGSRKPLISS